MSIALCCSGADHTQQQQQPCEHQRQIEHLTHELTSRLHVAMSLSMASSTKYDSRPKHAWFRQPGVLAAYDNYHHARRRFYRSSKLDDRLRLDKAAARRAWDRARRRAKEQSSSSSEVRQPTDLDVGLNLWRRAQPPRTTTTAKAKFRHPVSGQLPADAQESVNNAALSLSTIFRSQFHGTERGQQYGDTVRLLTSSAMSAFSSSSSPMNTELTKKEILEACLKLKPHKTPGPDNIPAVVLRCGSKVLREALFHIFNLCWLTGYIPQMWRCSEVNLAYKKEDVVATWWWWWWWWWWCRKRQRQQKGQRGRLELPPSVRDIVCGTLFRASGGETSARTRPRSHPSVAVWLSVKSRHLRRPLQPHVCHTTSPPSTPVPCGGVSGHQEGLRPVVGERPAVEALVQIRRARQDVFVLRRVLTRPLVPRRRSASRVDLVRHERQRSTRRRRLTTPLRVVYRRLAPQNHDRVEGVSCARLL